MSNANDFVIENGVLTKYKGKASAVVIPNGVSAIGDTAFKNKKNVVSVVIPEGVVKMGAKSFNGCCNLVSIYFPTTLTLGLDWFYNIFGGCTSLKEIIVSENNPEFSSWGGVLYRNFQGERTWLNFVPEGLETVEIPEGVKYISGGAFANCCHLTKLEFPKSLESIGDECFLGCCFEEPLVIPESVGSKLPCCRGIGVPILINYDHVDPKGREQALIGFSMAYCHSLPFDKGIENDYISYARKQRKKLYPLVMQNEYVRHLMLSEKIIPKEDARRLLEDAISAQNGQLSADLLEYLK